MANKRVLFCKKLCVFFCVPSILVCVYTAVAVFIAEFYFTSSLVRRENLCIILAAFYRDAFSIFHYGAGELVGAGSAFAAALVSSHLRYDVACFPSIKDF